MNISILLLKSLESLKNFNTDAGYRIRRSPLVSAAPQFTRPTSTYLCRGQGLTPPCYMVGPLPLRNPISPPSAAIRL